MTLKEETRTITFRIKRFNPAVDTKPYWDSFQLECSSGKTVLESIQEIIAKQDGSISLRYNCRAGVCGSCALLINNKFRNACETLVLDLDTDVVKVEPLPFYPVIKDLVVNMQPFYEKLRAINPFLIRNSEYPETEVLQTPADFKRIEEAAKCILCGACNSACPMFWTDKNYLGPAALLKAHRFVADTRDEATTERIKTVTSEDGIYRCHTAFNCVNACPKSLNPTYAIQSLKLASAKQFWKFWKR